MALEDDRAREWVNLIAGKFDRREDAARELSLHGLCEQDAAYILDMIDMAYSRSVMHNAIGLPMKNMRSNVDGDPVFRAALAHFQRAMKSASSEAGRDGATKPWWRFW